MILFINACVRKNSRTGILAEHLLGNLSDTVFPKVDEDFLIKRSGFAERNDFSDPMFGLAKEFAAADTIVIAAPFWDLSFPASLKQYFEQITVPGITFRYTDEGIPEGMCKAGRLFFVTTAGGSFVPEFGYGYIRSLVQGLYGIRSTELIKAEGLDIVGADTGDIISRAKESIDELFISGTHS